MVNINNIIVHKKRSALANFENNFHNFTDELGTNYKGAGLAYGIASALWKPIIVHNIPTIALPMVMLCVWPQATLDFDRYSFGGFLAATAAQEMFGTNLLHSAISTIKEHYYMAAIIAIGGYYLYNVDYEPEMLGQTTNTYY